MSDELLEKHSRGSQDSFRNVSDDALLDGWAKFAGEIVDVAEAKNTQRCSLCDSVCLRAVNIETKKSKSEVWACDSCGNVCLKPVVKFQPIKLLLDSLLAAVELWVPTDLLADAFGPDCPWDLSGGTVLTTSDWEEIRQALVGNRVQGIGAWWQPADDSATGPNPSPPINRTAYSLLATELKISR